MKKIIALILRIALILFLIGSFFIPLGIATGPYWTELIIPVFMDTSDTIRPAEIVMVSITGTAILLGIIDLFVERKWLRFLVPFMTLLAAISYMVMMIQGHAWYDFETSYYDSYFGLGWFVFAIELVFVCVLSYFFYVDYIKDGGASKAVPAEGNTNHGEKKEKKPSKFKRVLINTGRVNSPSFVGALYGKFGTDPNNGYLVNINKEGGLLVYSNNSDDLILLADAIEEVTFQEKTNWYSYGPGEAIDLVFKIKCKDETEGTLKLPLIKAKHSENLLQEFRIEKVNKALNAIGMKGLNYKSYQVAGITDDRKTFNEFFVCQSDDELLNELRLNYGSGIITAPANLKGTKF